MITYKKIGPYHVALDYEQRDNSLFRLACAWLAGVAGALLFVVGVLWVGLH